MDAATEKRLLDQLEVEEIKTLKYRYMRFMMLGEVEAMRELLTPDVKAEYSDGKYSYDGVESVLEFLRGTHAEGSGLRSIWQLGHPEIEIHADGRATGVWFFTHKTIHKPSGTNIEMASFYRDEYVKQDGRWRIRYTDYRRVLEQHWSNKDLPSAKIDVG